MVTEQKQITILRNVLHKHYRKNILLLHLHFSPPTHVIIVTKYRKANRIVEDKTTCCSTTHFIRKRSFIPL